MKAKQALVTCGGIGSRLRKGGIEFPLSKSFLELEGHPMLYWCLLGLHFAGIEKLVIVGDSQEKLEKAKQVLSDFPCKFLRVDYHEDSGLGVTGLPYHARHLLDDKFLFECGHSVSEPEHYHQLESELKNGDGIIFSSFKPNPYAVKPYIKLDGQKIIPISNLTGDNNEFSVDYPFLLNQKYISKLPELDFDLYKIIRFYDSSGSLKLVQSNMPIEVDVVKEWEEAIPVYRTYIKNLCGRAGIAF